MNINALTPDLDVFNTPVSSFKNSYGVDPEQIILKNWLFPDLEMFGGLYSTVLKIRDGGTDPAHKKILKASLPAISPGARMHTRSAQATDEERNVIPTGWMQFDIDPQHNPHIPFVPDLKTQIARIVYVAYCGLSVSGNGLWGLVRISDPKDYVSHFRQVCIDFRSRGIILDPSKGGNPTDLRYWAYDPEPHVNTNFKIYDRKYQQIKFKQPTTKRRNTNSHETGPERAIENIEKWLANKMECYQTGNKHTYLVKLFAACNRSGVPLETAKQLVTSKYAYTPSDDPVPPQNICKIANKVYQLYSNSYGAAPFENQSNY